MVHEDFLQTSSVLVTGAAGTVGSAICEHLVGRVKALRCFDSSEKELFHLNQGLKGRGRVSPLLGDIRDMDRLRFAMSGIDVVFHAAALKHVELGEYNPFEVVQTNLQGVNNVIRASLDADVDRMVFTSSDKAVNPTNVMGASKMMGERLVSAANEIRGSRRTRFASVRFGNVLGSSGSVIPTFARQVRLQKPITLTHPEMTRYVMTVEDAAQLVVDTGATMRGGEIHVAKMQAIRIRDLGLAIAEVLGIDGIRFKEIGIRPGEKLYEELVTNDERARTLDIGSRLVVLPWEGARYAGAASEEDFPESRWTKHHWNSSLDAVMSVAELAQYLEQKKILAPYQRGAEPEVGCAA